MISACIITKNEEQNLENCIKSLKDYTDEIIINDTGSTDNTIAIAEKFDCKIIQNKWEDDFAKARNQSLEEAKGDIILIIDADEIITNPEILKEINNNNDPIIGGWTINLSSMINGIEHKSKLLRIFRNNGFKFHGVIHEQIAKDIIRKGYKIEESKLHIQHSGYDLYENERNQKQIRNLKLLKKALQIEPENAYYHYHNSKTNLNLKNTEEALISIAKAIDLVNDKNSKAEYYKIQAKIYFDQKYFQKALKAILKSIQLNNTDKEALFIAAELYFTFKNYEESIKYYLHTSEHYNSINKISGSIKIPKEQLDFKIGKCYLQLNDLKNAIKYFMNGIENNPYMSFNYVGAANVFFKDRNFVEAEKFIHKALELEPNNISIRRFKNKVENQTKSKKSATLSVSMIVKNEEKMLADALECVKDIATEIVIVDTGSDDNTINIAKENSAKIHHFKWIDDFSAARNESLKHCTSDWILYLDADERIDPESAELIVESIRNADDETGGFYCIIESAHTTKEGESEVHRGGYPRLFRNLGYPDIYFKGKIHEQISPSIVSKGFKIEPSEIVIKHLGYKQDSEVLEEKAKRNYKLLMEQINEDPDNGYLWYQLGQTLGRLQLIDESIKALEFALNCGVSESISASATAALSQYSGNNSDFKNALKWAEESLKIAPKQIYGLNLKAHALLYLKRFDEAKEIFQEAISLSRKKKTLPETGFDIDVSEDIMQKGLEKAINKNI